MGDATDHADVGRFMRSKEGQRALDRFCARLEGKRIERVGLTHNGSGIGIELTLEGGGALDLAETLNAFAVESLRERYARVLDREYSVDFPERRPHTAVGGGVVPDAEALCCPKCGQCEAFAVETWQWLTLYPDGTATEGDESQQWDADSPCRCESCQHEGTGREFLARPGE